MSWRWCFWINLIISPISLIVSVFALKLPKPTQDSIWKKCLKFDYAGALTLAGGTVCILLGISWGGNAFEWSDSRVIGTLVGGAATLVAFYFVEQKVRDPLIDASLFHNRTVLAITAAEFFYGANLIGLMYYVPQFFQLVFGDSATLSGVGLLPMMLGLGVGNPIAAFITSRYKVSLINAQVGAIMQTLASGLMVRWDAGTTRVEAVILLVILGIGQGAGMSGLLLTAQAAVKSPLVGIVTGLTIFVQTVGDNFGIAFFAAVYINELRSSLNQLAISKEDVTNILADVTYIKHHFDQETQQEIVKVYAVSMRNGWWLMFACALVTLLLAALAKQHEFKDHESESEDAT